jgi:hypothetical protein
MIIFWGTNIPQASELHKVPEVNDMLLAVRLTQLWS